MLRWPTGHGHEEAASATPGARLWRPSPRPARPGSHLELTGSCCCSQQVELAASLHRVNREQHCNRRENMLLKLSPNKRTDPRTDQPAVHPVWWCDEEWGRGAPLRGKPRKDTLVCTAQMAWCPPQCYLQLFARMGLSLGALEPQNNLLLLAVSSSGRSAQSIPSGYALGLSCCLHSPPRLDKSILSLALHTRAGGNRQTTVVADRNTQSSALTD